MFIFYGFNKACASRSDIHYIANIFNIVVIQFLSIKILIFNRKNVIKYL
jgi:hypothetical protein